MKKYILVSILSLVLAISCAQQGVIIDQAGPTQVKNVDMLKNGNTTGIETQEVNYGPAVGFLAKPKKEGKYPGIVMIHEFWGLNDNIKEMARSLAAEGYVVLAVDLYNGKVAKDAKEASQFMAPINKDPSGAVQNMKAAVKYLKSLGIVDKSRMASIGWCFGGGMSLQLALNEPLNATVIYYGFLTDNKAKLSNIKWPVLGIFGDKDQVISVDSVNKFKTALDELGIKNEIYIYPGVGHAFANPSGMNYAPNETKDAWQKTVEFLSRNLKNK